MVDDLPAVIHALIQVGCHDASVLGVVRVTAGNIFSANHPGHVARHLDL